MALRRFNRVVDELDIAGVLEIEQRDIKVQCFDAKEDQYLFYSKGMNPCAGIILSGTIEVTLPGASTGTASAAGVGGVTDKKEKQDFAVMNHYEGVTSADAARVMEEKTGLEERQKIIHAHCSKVIKTMLAQTIEEYRLSLTSDSGDDADEDKRVVKIVLSHSFILHCTQPDPTNLQNMAVTKLADILSSEEKIQPYINELIRDKNLPTEFKFEHYVANNFRPPEEQGKSIDCYVRIEKGTLEILHDHCVPSLEKRNDAEGDDSEEDPEEVFAAGVSRRSVAKKASGVDSEAGGGGRSGAHSGSDDADDPKNDDDAKVSSGDDSDSDKHKQTEKKKKRGGGETSSFQLADAGSKIAGIKRKVDSHPLPSSGKEATADIARSPTPAGSSGGGGGKSNVGEQVEKKKKSSTTEATTTNEPLPSSSTLTASSVAVAAPLARTLGMHSSRMVAAAAPAKTPTPAKRSP